MIWTTRDGQVLQVSEMKTTYLNNVIALVKRQLLNARANERAAWNTYGTLQGDMAKYYCEQDCDRLTSRCMELEEKLHSLKTELRRRQCTTGSRL